MDQVAGLFATASRTIGLAKGDVRKIAIARRPQTETAVPPEWMATELHLGTWTNVSNLLAQPDGFNQPNRTEPVSKVRTPLRRSKASLKKKR
jgi:hypothetical protein